MDAVRERFEERRKVWAQGQSGPLFDPEDAIFWYLLQATAYATPDRRHDYFEPDAFRISPVFARLGQMLSRLSSIVGIEDRLETLMTKGKSQPDAGLYEILVAGAYKSRGWNVAFVPEQPGVAKAQDLLVTKGRHRWAVECKRVNRNKYEEQEYQRALALARPIHSLAEQQGVSVLCEVMFLIEMKDVPDEYLQDHLRDYLSGPRSCVWKDEVSIGCIQSTRLDLLQQVLQYDHVFYNSSRMVELLAGGYRQDFDHSVKALWEPAPQHPIHASWVSQASVVSWRSASPEAAESKARHFRALIAKATKQLPSDYPGVVHVGYEALGNNSVDEQRHIRNRLEMKRFDPIDSRLRWVYANYLMPEHTTARNENWAVSETTACYRIGKHRVPEPLPDHIILDREDGEPGVHWRG
ncbi:hypothetical protein [Halopseudomonas litoralis]|uniref:hypothetical protein n=1 Tax=Halopseudomonas litoralis TaxID=797277 RepID=UPI000B289252|nr:hypothetical protein [Halopseudomonas litoralis]